MSSVAVTELGFCYPHEPALFNNLNYQFRARAVTLIQGPSGSGKSTFLKILAGLASPLSGQITIEEASSVSYMDQDCQLVNHWSVLENLQLFSGDVPKITKLLQELNLENRKNILAKNLSGGERQRVAFIRLLLRRPLVALMDEPTAHLDDFQLEKMKALIASHLSASTVIIVSHDTRLTAFANQVWKWGVL